MGWNEVIFHTMNQNCKKKAAHFLLYLFDVQWLLDEQMKTFFKKELKFVAVKVDSFPFYRSFYCCKHCAI